MKKHITIILFLILVVSCKNNAENNVFTINEITNEVKLASDKE